MIDDFWLAHPELDRDGPCEIIGEHRCTDCCNPKPRVRSATKAERERDGLPRGAKIYYRKGSISATARGLKRTLSGREHFVAAPHWGMVVLA